MKTHEVTHYEPLQIMPAGGVKAVYRDPNGVLYASDIVGFAVCRVWETVHETGTGRRVGGRKAIRREVCGIDCYVEDGLSVCEEMSNHTGYITPDQNLADYNAK